MPTDPTRTQPRAHRHARASVYVLVLVTVALVVGVGVTTVQLSTADSQRVELLHDLHAARALARSGLDLLAQRLTDAPDWRDAAAKSATTAAWTLDTGSITGRIVRAGVTPLTDVTAADTSSMRIGLASLGRSGEARATLYAEVDAPQTPLAVNRLNALSPVSLWPMTEAVGATSARDIRPLANAGVYSNPNSVGGVTLPSGERAPYFNKTGDIVTIAHNEAYLLNAYTFAVWVYPTALRSTMGLFSKNRSGRNAGDFEITLKSLRPCVVFQTTLTDLTATSPTGLSLDEWSLLVVSIGPSGGLRMFINGSLVLTDAAFGGASLGKVLLLQPNGNTNPIVIGAAVQENAGVVSLPLAGSTRAVALIGRELSDAEVSTLYSNGYNSTDAWQVVPGSIRWHVE